MYSVRVIFVLSMKQYEVQNDNDFKVELVQAIHLYFVCQCACTGVWNASKSVKI